MDKFSWYRKYFEENSKFLWSDICRMSPKAAAARITEVVWARIRLIKMMSGYESAGYWACQFSELTEVLVGLENKAMALAEIKRFRECAQRQREYRRSPEDQGNIFKSPKWARDFVRIAKGGSK